MKQRTSIAAAGIGFCKVFRFPLTVLLLVRPRTVDKAERLDRL